MKLVDRFKTEIKYNPEENRIEGCIYDLKENKEIRYYIDKDMKLEYMIKPWTKSVEVILEYLDSEGKISETS